MRSFLRSILILVAVVVLPLAARASDNIKTFEFLGFSEDGNKYMLKVVDANRGDTFVVKALSDNKTLKALPLEGVRDVKKLLDQTKKHFKITDKGKDDQTSPDGRFTFMAVPRGEKLLLNVMKGNKTATYQTYRLEKGDNGSVPKVQLKQIFWAKDGHKMVVILHKKLVDQNGIDADEAYGYEFFGGSLNFK